MEKTETPESYLFGNKNSKEERERKRKHKMRDSTKNGGKESTERGERVPLKCISGVQGPSTSTAQPTKQKSLFNKREREREREKQT